MLKHCCVSVHGYKSNDSLYKESFLSSYSALFVVLIVLIWKQKSQLMILCLNDSLYRESCLSSYSTLFILFWLCWFKSKIPKFLSEQFWIENVLLWREGDSVGCGFRQSNLYKKVKVYRDMKGKKMFKL